PYLPYYIGRLHEELLAAAAARRAELEGKASRTAEEEAELGRLKADEAAHKEKAIAAYLAFVESGSGDDAFFTRLINLAPGSAEARYARAEAYRQAGNWLAAEGEYRQAIELRPTFVAAHIGRGDALTALELYKSAAEAYQKALELQPGTVSLLLKLAFALLKDGQLGEAGRRIQEALAKEPNNAAALALQGDLLLAQGDTAGAIARYDAAYRRSPSADHLLKLAGAYLAAGRLEDARKRYEDATRVYPYRADGHLGLGDTLLKLGDRDKALASYRQALTRAAAVGLKETIARKIVDLDPQDVRTRYLLAGYFREQYKYDGAIAQYEAILAQAPGTLDALIGLGDCYLAKVAYDRALEYYRQALAKAGTPQQKLSILDQMVKVEEGRAGTGKPLGPQGLEFLWQRAQVLAELGRTQQAVDDLERIEETDPTFRKEEVRALLGRLTQAQPQ
ncbi:MAG: tetratricopeptide repeat protein, partial [Candidatus Bipolaricaulota bacterium]|nr:tetratricopeptide repeat protein [Candidatus Bipolaricaulota bacterium]